MTARTDAELVQAIRAGDREAFEVLHRRYARLLERRARVLLGSRRGVAEDLVQETFERAYGSEGACRVVEITPRCR